MDKNKVQWALRKGGKYLSGLFCEPLEFMAETPANGYLYNVEQIAYEVAEEAGAECVPLYNGKPLVAVETEQRDCHGCFFSINNRYNNCPERCCVSTTHNQPCIYKPRQSVTV